MRKNHNPHILNGSLARGVITLSGPIMLAMFFSSLLNIVDTFWVGKISAVAVAAISISWPIVFILIALSAGISTGCNALVARYFGASDIPNASKVAKNSLALGAVLSAVLLGGGLLTAPSLFRFLGAGGDMLAQALDYTNIIFFGTVFLVGTFILGAILRGEGNTKTSMWIGIGVNIINMVLDPLFIFGFGWGVAGAAWATVLSSALGLVVYYWYFAGGRSAVPIVFDRLDLSWQFIYDILFIGVPASLRNVTNAIGVFFSIKVVALHGAAAVAAYGIAFRVESFGVLPVVAIALSTVTMVGQNLGAQQLLRAKKSGWVSTALGMSIMAVFGVFVFIFSDVIIQIFNGEPAVVAVGTDVLKIKSPAFMFSAVIFTLGSAFQAFGKSHYALILTITRVVLMIALVYWFNHLFGLIGVWWAIVVSGVLSALGNAAWYYYYRPKYTPLETGN